MVAIVYKAAHVVNVSHPIELAATVEAWLDDALRVGTHLPDGVRLFLGHPGDAG